MTIDKEKLVDLLVEKTGLKKKVVEDQLSELVDQIQKSAREGRDFEIEGFGIFSMHEDRLTFEPASELKTEINNKYAGMEPIELIGAYKDINKGEKKAEPEFAEEESEEEETEPEPSVPKGKESSPASEKSDKKQPAAKEDEDEGKAGEVEEETEDEDEVWGWGMDEDSSFKLDEDIDKQFEEAISGSKSKEEDEPEPEPEPEPEEEEKSADRGVSKSYTEELIREAAAASSRKKEDTTTQPEAEEEPAEQKKEAKWQPGPELKADTTGKKKKKEKKKDPIGTILVVAVLIAVVGVGAWFAYDMGLFSGQAGPADQGQPPVTTQDQTGLQQQPPSGGEGTSAQEGGVGMTEDNVQTQQTEDPGETQSQQQNQESAESEPGSSEPDDQSEVAEDEGLQTGQTIYGLNGDRNPDANNGYTIVVHSLKEEAKARDIQNQLDEEGYRTVLQSATVNGVPYWRVGLGQFQTVDDAVNRAEDLPEPFRSNFFIKRIR